MKDRYLVINEDSLLNKEIIIFFCLWDYIINKIKYLRGDANEVIIKDSNKIRFSSDVFIPNDVLLSFYSLVIVINYVIEKMMNLFLKFILMTDIFYKSIA